MGSREVETLELRVAFQSSSPPEACTSETEYWRTPLHGSAKPDQLAFTCAKLTLPTKLSWFPSTSTMLTLPLVGPSQQYFTLREAAARCKPAQLVARTVA